LKDLEGIGRGLTSSTVCPGRTEENYKHAARAIRFDILTQNLLNMVFSKFSLKILLYIHHNTSLRYEILITSVILLKYQQEVQNIFVQLTVTN
jgi:hypothetical protein